MSFQRVSIDENNNCFCKSINKNIAKVCLLRSFSQILVCVLKYKTIQPLCGMHFVLSHTKQS